MSIVCVVLIDPGRILSNLRSGISVDSESVYVTPDASNLCRDCTPVLQICGCNSPVWTRFTPHSVYSNSVTLTDMRRAIPCVRCVFYVIFTQRACRLCTNTFLADVNLVYMLHCVFRILNAHLNTLRLLSADQCVVYVVLLRCAVFSRTNVFACMQVRFLRCVFCVLQVHFYTCVFCVARMFLLYVVTSARRTCSTLRCVIASAVTF